MPALVDELNTLEREALARLSETPDEKGLEEWRVEVLGRRGGLAELLRGLGAVPGGAPRRGVVGNRVKGALEAAFAERQRSLRERSRERELEAERIDVTLPGRGYQRGLLHPVTQLRREVERVFIRLGFTVVEGPEVEYDRYNFTLLNMPEDHPSRDAQDTFYVANVGGRSRKATRRWCCARTPPRCRSGRCSRSPRRSGSSSPAGLTAMRRRTPPTSCSSPRWRVCAWTSRPRWATCGAA